MKKLIILILTVAMVAGICGCSADVGETTAPTPDILLAGFGRAFITPEENLPLGGFGSSSTRIMTDVLDDTFVSCIALTDANDSTVLLMCVDLQRIEDNLINLLKAEVKKATGVPTDRIIISCSHTHSIPDLLLNTEGLERYVLLLRQRFAQAAQIAMADRKPSGLLVGTTETKQLNFVKHYQHTLEDGSVAYFGDNFGTEVINDTTRHVTDAYSDMHLIQIIREGGKDIVIANFRSHPTITGGVAKTNLSSDFIGPWRTAVEETLGCHFAFIQGACGNINPRSRLNAENLVGTGDHITYGYLLAQATIKGLEQDMHSVDTGIIQCQQLTCKAKVDHSQDHLLDYAYQVQAYHKLYGSFDKTREYGSQFGISSYYHAGAITKKVAMDEFQNIELMVFSIGDEIGFFSAPGELFDVCSVEMEEKSPFPLTITVGFTNGDWKYFPQGECSKYASYESDYGRFELGTAEQMMDTWLVPLRQFYSNAHG